MQHGWFGAGVPFAPPLHICGMPLNTQLHTLWAQHLGDAIFIPFAATVSAQVFAALARTVSFDSKPGSVGVAPHKFDASAHVTPPKSIAKLAMKTTIRTTRITSPCL